MKVWLVASREGFPRDYNDVYLSEGTASSVCKAMNKAVKKEKYEVVCLNVVG